MVCGEDLSFRVGIKTTRSYGERVNFGIYRKGILDNEAG